MQVFQPVNTNSNNNTNCTNTQANNTTNTNTQANNTNCTNTNTSINHHNRLELNYQMFQLEDIAHKKYQNN